MSFENYHNGVTETTPGSNTSLLKLLVVEVVKDRPEHQRYQTLASRLTDGFVEVAEAEGWQVELVGAEELGRESLLAQADQADAVVVLGGEDVHPKFSGQPEGYPGSGKHREAADAAQIALVQHTLETGQPTLGICRGSQLINVALGGDLIQHIESDAHRNLNILNDLTLVTHEVALDTDTDLGERLSSNGEKILVQSSHHQAVNRLGDGLRMVAIADDGIIEAYEHENAPIFAVQWHPEDPNTNREQLAILLDKLRGDVLARR